MPGSRNQVLNRGGVPGDRGVSFFSPEGRNLLTTLRAVVLPAAVVALSEGDCGICGCLQTMPQPCVCCCHCLHMKK
jgi:hypothetical protein